MNIYENQSNELWKVVNYFIHQAHVVSEHPLAITQSKYEMWITTVQRHYSCLEWLSGRIGGGYEGTSSTLFGPTSNLQLGQYILSIDNDLNNVICSYITEKVVNLWNVRWTNLLCLLKSSKYKCILPIYTLDRWFRSREDRHGYLYQQYNATLINVNYKTI